MVINRTGDSNEIYHVTGILEGGYGAVVVHFSGVSKYGMKVRKIYLKNSGFATEMWQNDRYHAVIKEPRNKI